MQGGTFIHFLLTVEPSVACWTVAYVSVSIVPFFAFSLVKAGCICAGQFPVLTVCPFKPLWALTPIAILRVLQEEKKRYTVYQKAPCQMFSLSYPVHECPDEPHYP